MDLLGKMPPDSIEEIFPAQIQKLQGPPNSADKGFAAPLNIFLFQELQRLQRIIFIVRVNLESLAMAIDGTVVMTTDLLEDLNSVFDARARRSAGSCRTLAAGSRGWWTGRSC